MNEALIFESMIDIPGGNSDFSGPEGIVSADDGSLYVSSGDGWIYQVINNQVRPFAQVGGRPLGIVFDLDKNLFVCEAESRSIIRISPKAEIEKVIDRIGSRKLQAPNYAVFDDSGWLFFSDSGSSTIDFQSNAARNS